MKTLSIEKMEAIEGGIDLLHLQCAIEWLTVTEGASEAELAIWESLFAQTICYIYMY
jgi:bacteriocin-like protein